MGYGHSNGIIVTENEKDLPTFNARGKPNTRYDYYQFGQLKSSRWTNALGIPIKSRHYTNHGKPKAHPTVPHDHDWGWQDGKWTEFKQWYEPED